MSSELNTLARGSKLKARSLYNMHNPRLATRYAKSLIGLAIEKGQLENVFADMKWLHGICKTNVDFVALLRSPIVKSDKKHKILDSVTGDSVNGITKAFMKLLVNKGRESNLPEIASAYVHQYKEHKQIYDVKLITATPASEELKNAILNHLRSTTKMQNIELETAVDEKLIGGFVLRVGDQLVDASIAYDLKNISRQFDNNDFIYKVR
jgi:F-type H+-transporting ATPase subunit delta